MYSFFAQDFPQHKEGKKKILYIYIINNVAPIKIKNINKRKIYKNNIIWMAPYYRKNNK